MKRFREFVVPALFLTACGVAAGNPDRPTERLRIDHRYPPAATAGTPLTLQGRDFGDAPGTVRIGGRQVDILSWSSAEVVVRSPGDTTTACEAARVYDANGDYSNAVPFSYGDRGVWLPNTEEPTARQFPLSVWTGDEMFVWGGSSSQGGRYNPRTDTWLPVASFGGVEANDAFSASHGFWTGEEVLIWTGFGGGRYDPSEDSWRPISLSGAPKTEGGSSAVWTGEEMLVWGAFGGGRYNPQTDRWRPMSDVIENDAEATTTLKRAYHTAVWTGEAMIVWGGQLYDRTSETIASGAAYDPDEDRWEVLPKAPNFGPRAFHIAAWTGTEMLVWGGADAPLPNGAPGTNRVSGARYEPDAKRWKTMSAQGAPTGPVGATGVWMGGKWFIFGGRQIEPGSAPHQGGAVYDPRSDTWQPLGADSSPLSRANATGVWTGKEVLLWGGLGPDLTPISDGGRYDPKHDRWAPMNGLHGVPAPRGGHTYLWTGSEVIVWGGFQDTGYARQEAIAQIGSRYNPVTNEWLPMDQPEGVRGRVWHSAVWTGDEMIISGGKETPEPRDDSVEAIREHQLGATTSIAYRPSTGEWRTLAFTESPAGLEEAAAVWTGEEMIVWGGGTNGVAYATQTDTWRPLGQNNAPPARHNANLVWTGSEVIAYGGGASPMPEQNNFIDSGGRYDPSTDKWHSMTSSGFLDIGGRSSAVWTGGELVLVGRHAFFEPCVEVYEGKEFTRNCTRYAAQGGRYDPDLNTWVELNLADAPIGHLSDSAWTGDEVLVFSSPDLEFQRSAVIKGFRYSLEKDEWSSIRCGCDSYAYSPLFAGYPKLLRAVWTGNAAQIWSLHTGGITYIP